MDYIHFNPVKHGYVSVVAQWPHSTFHRWVKAGAYPHDLGGDGVLMLPLANVDDNLVTCHSTRASASYGGAEEVTWQDEVGL